MPLSCKPYRNSSFPNVGVNSIESTPLLRNRLTTFAGSSPVITAESHRVASLFKPTVKIDNLRFSKDTPFIIIFLVVRKEYQNMRIVTLIMVAIAQLALSQLISKIPLINQI